MHKSSIYILIDPLSEEIRYVGKTSQTLRARLQKHLREKKRNHRTNWLRSLTRLGLLPRIELVQEVPSTQWPLAERYWIQYYRNSGCPLVNGTDGGEGLSGRKCSDATKEKLSIATKRQFSNPAAREAVSKVHKGKTISEEHRDVVGKANTKRWEEWRAKGCSASQETRDKVRRSRLGKPTSQKTKDKIRKALAGRPKSPEHRAKLAAANRARAISSKRN